MSDPSRVHSNDQANFIVGLGESLFDIFPNRSLLGGAPLNVAFHASQLPLPERVRIAMVSRVGDDSLGDQVNEALIHRKISTEGLQRDSVHPTGIVQVVMHEGEPNYTIVEGAAWDFLEWTPELERIAERSIAICFGSLGQRTKQSKETIQKFLKVACGAIRLFDINLRPPFCDQDTLRESCRLATMIKCNQDEVATLFELMGLSLIPLPDISDSVSLLKAIEELRLQLGLDAIMVTRSEKGCMIASRRGSAIGNPVPLDLLGLCTSVVSDPVGAGDATSAVLLVGWLHAWPIDRIAETANRLGAFVASRPGATPEIPSDFFGHSK